MKQKTDEMPDEWIRQTLSSLPDAPPPGSSLDSGRLWKQLQPELQQIPTRRRIGWIWIAAACLVGFVLGWFWLKLSARDQKVIANHKPISKAAAPVISLRKPKLIHRTSTSVSTLAAKSRPKLQRYKASIQNDISKQLTIPTGLEPGEMVATLPEPTTVVSILPIAEKLPELPKAKVAISTPKRRFKVVHENELRAEEESRPKLYPIQNFVRLGSGRGEETPTDNHSLTITLPLIHKPNQ